VRQAEADEDRLEGLQQSKIYVDFLSKEVHYNSQLLSCLKAIQEADEMLNNLEIQASENNIVDALYTLAGRFCHQLAQTLVADGCFVSKIGASFGCIC
jgi:hypothetical protein